MRFLAAILLLLSALPAHAQNMQRALVVSSCGSQALAAGPLTNLTMNPQGQLCLNGIGGGPSVPAISVAPVVTGSTTVGSTLSSTTGTWTNSPTGYAYQWLRNGTAISGATGSAYLTVSADAGTSVGSQVTASNAGGNSLPSTSNTIAIVAAPTYTGPGDVVASATAWWGLRAYNGAYAAATGKSVNLRRASDNATCDFAVSSSGGLGVSVATCATGLGLTPAAFATQDATASCTIATNTATCTGASSTPHVGSTVAGSGVGQPCYVTAVGTFTSGAGTVTLTGGLNTTLSAPCGTVGSAATLTFTYGLYATKLYDQSGATNCTGPAACDASQATAAKQPQMLLTCLNGLPCLSFVTASAQLLASPTVPTALATVLTASTVSVRNATFTTAGRIVGSGAVSFWLSYFAAANTAQLFQGTAVNPTVSDSVWHSLGASFAAGSATFFSLDGVAGAPTTAGTTSWGASAIQLGATVSTNFLNGYMTEAGIWNTSLSSGQLTSICHNQFTYWGTSTSC